MRLTLPVLLDYLDQRLDPSLAAEVEARLERDPAAQALLQRAKQALEQNHRRAAALAPAPTTWKAFVLRSAPTLLLLTALCAVIFFGAWWFDEAWSSPPEDAPPNLHPAVRASAVVDAEATGGTHAVTAAPVSTSAVAPPAAVPRAAAAPPAIALAPPTSKAPVSPPAAAPTPDPTPTARPTGTDAGRRASNIASRPTPKLTGVRKADPIPTAPPAAPPGENAVRPASLETPAVASPAPGAPPPSDAAAAAPAAPAAAPVPPAATVAPSAPAAAPPAPVGEPPVCATAEFTSLDDTLIRYDSAARLWRLVTPGEPLVAGRLLLAPPSGCASLMLRDGLIVDLQPESLVEFEAPAPGEPPTLRIWFGRVRLTASQDGQRLHVAAGGWKTPISFPTAAAMASIEVRPFTQSGVDPRATTEERAIDVRVAREGVMIGADAQAKLHIVPARLVVAPHPLDSISGTTPADAPPSWSAERDALTVEARRVLTIVRERAAVESSLPTALGKLVHDRNSAVRHVAALWLACLGDFGPLVDELSAPDLLVLWRDESVAALAQATARGPLWAKRVEHALLVERGPLGPELFRMLWRYSTEQLREGAAVQLVDRLDHEELDVRVLAFWNLQILTGVGLHYRPEMQPLQRRPLVDRWRERMVMEHMAPMAR